MSVSIVAVVVMLAGCAGGEPHPPQTFGTYTSTVSASATPSPTPTVEATGVPTAVPVRPPEMDATGGTGAAAAAEYFLELHLYALATGDLTEFDAVSSTDCRFCASLRADVAQTYGEGGHFSPSTMTIESITVPPPHPTLGGYPVSVMVTIESGAKVDASGTELASATTRSGELVVDVIFGTHGWTLVDVSRGDAA